MRVAYRLRFPNQSKRLKLSRLRSKEVVMSGAISDTMFNSWQDLVLVDDKMSRLSRNTDDTAVISH